MEKNIELNVEKIKGEMGGTQDYISSDRSWHCFFYDAPLRDSGRRGKVKRTMSAGNLKRITCLSLVLCCAALLLTPYESEGSQIASDVGKAVVKKGPVQVHSGPSAKSRVIKSLARGSAVTVEIEMNTSDGLWCGVAEQGASALLGYVSCDSLDQRKASSVQWKLIDTKVSESQPVAPVNRGMSAPEKPKRPYSDITVLLYMTTW